MVLKRAAVKLLVRVARSTHAEEARKHPAKVAKKPAAKLPARLPARVLRRVAH